MDAVTAIIVLIAQKNVIQGVKHIVGLMVVIAKLVTVVMR